MRYQPSATGLLLCLCLGASAPCALADNGDIVITRDVQPRVATRAPLVPDPNPVTINVSPHEQVTRQTQRIDQTPGELSDSDFANINSGLSLPNRLLGTGNPQALTSTLQQRSGGPGHSAGSVSSGIGTQINRSVQQGLSPLQNLGAR